jgi:signal transduction histidine kinase
MGVFLMLVMGIIGLVKHDSLKQKLSSDSARVFLLLREKEQQLQGAQVIGNTRRITSILSQIRERNQLPFMDYSVGPSHVTTLGSPQECHQIQHWKSQNPFSEQEETGVSFCLNEKISGSLPKVDLLILILFIGFTLGSSALIRWFLESQLLTPMNHLISAMKSGPTSQVKLPQNTNQEVLQMRDALVELRSALLSSQDAEIQTQQLNQFSRESAHNLLPLVVGLRSREAEFDVLPEELKKLLSSSLSRIYVSCYRWLHLSKDNADTGEIRLTFLNDLLEAASETAQEGYKSKTNLQIKRIKTTPASPAFSLIDEHQFLSVIGNLIQNSVEALKDQPQGLITLRMDTSEDEHRIIIEDNGPGIPPDMHEEVFLKGVTYGKPNGSGIGLYHARKCVEKWGGSISILPSGRSGTQMELRLLKMNAPRWFTNQVEIRPGMEVVILEDDPGTHMNWSAKFKSYVDQHQIKLISFYSPAALIRFVQSSPQENRRFLIDQNIPAPGEALKTGLQVIRELNLSSKSTLVTTAYQDAQVQEEANELDLKILPKTLIWESEILFLEVLDQEKSQGNLLVVDAVLIDDQSRMREWWKRSGAQAGIQVLTYESVVEFFKHAREIPLTTPIYIDSMLSDGVIGEVESEKIYDVGFKTIYLSSSRPTSNECPPWIKKFVSKTPPWAKDPFA